MDNNESVETNAIDEIVSAYKDIVEKKGIIPAYLDFDRYEITRKKITHHFGNITLLHEHMRENHAEFMALYILDEHTVFTSKRLDKLKSDLQNFKRFVVTTVVSNKKVNLDFYNSIKSYCEKNDAKLICIPCQDVVNRKTLNNFHFPIEMADENFIMSDTEINENLFISSIKLSAKHIRPITGLARIGQRNGSYIFASPKQFLEYVVTSTDKEKMPHAIMTTGAITESNYDTDRYLSDRTSYIAENDHVYGAIIVEVEDEKKFHFRQIQADDEGSFIDLAKRYSADGKVSSVRPVLVMGDLHAGEHDADVFDMTMSLIRELSVRDVVLHDAFSGYSVSHYDENSPHRKSMKYLQGRNKFTDEVIVGVDIFEDILQAIDGVVYRVKGNHDEWFERYLERAGYVNDAVNHYDALEYARYYLEGKEPLQEAYRKYMQPDFFKRMVFLSRDDSYKVGGVELAKHGDKGLNGSIGSLIGAEKAFGDCVVGHSHSAAIHRSVYRVGTTTELQLSYNSGPSSWTHTHCLVYPDGSRQLINMLGGAETSYTI